MAESSAWLKCLTPSGQERARAGQVVCFPHSGGAASGYRPLAAELDSNVGTIGIQYPGRQERYDEPLITDLHTLADQVSEILRQEPADTPRIFLGHSMGAILAYEVAQRLGANGPVALIASGRPAPSRVRLTTSYLLDDTALAEQVISLGGTAAELFAHPEMRSLLLPLIRGDYRASETYRPRNDGPLRCRLIALGGDADPTTSFDDLQAWSDHTIGEFRMEVFAGGHFFLFNHWPEVADLVRSIAMASL
jgi:pyochelin biosynthesis protein PchC